MMTNQTLSPVPEGYHTVNPWVITKGAAQFIQFLEQVFEARERKEARTPDDDGLLIHAEVQIGDTVIGIFDSKADWQPTPSFLQVYVEDAEATLKRAQEADAEIVTELSDFVYGESSPAFEIPGETYSGSISGARRSIGRLKQNDCKNL
jgi:uncharacterized glyoxalase superfamily protein PhnB